MAKVKALIKFRDLKAEVIRNKDDEFIVNKERSEDLQNLGFVESLDENKEDSGDVGTEVKASDDADKTLKDVTFTHELKEDIKTK